MFFNGQNYIELVRNRHDQTLLKTTVTNQIIFIIRNRIILCIIIFQSTSPSPCPPGSPPVGPLSLTTRPEDQQPPPSTPSSVKQEDARVSSGSEDDETRPTGPLPPGFSLVPSSMFGHGIMYMSPYLPPRGPAGCSTSMLDERRKRNRTFIDPVTEVPRLEAWFTHNTHPSHAVSCCVRRYFNYRHVNLSRLILIQ